MISEIDILTRAFSKTRFALLEIHIFILQNAISLAVYINSMEKLTLHCMQPDKMVWATQSVVGINSIGGQYTATLTSLLSELMHFNPAKDNACQKHFFFFEIFSCPVS